MWWVGMGKWGGEGMDVDWGRCRGCCCDLAAWRGIHTHCIVRGVGYLLMYSVRARFKVA